MILCVAQEEVKICPIPDDLARGRTAVLPQIFWLYWERWRKEDRDRWNKERRVARQKQGPTGVEKKEEEEVEESWPVVEPTLVRGYWRLLTPLVPARGLDHLHRVPARN